MAASMNHDLFNAKMQEFVRDLCSAFPDVEDFKLFRNALTLSLSFAPQKPQQMFDKFVVSHYAQYIMDRDEQFFLNHDFGHVVSDDDFDIVERIRNVWDRMDDGNKDIVWKYLRILLLLNNKCKTT